MHRLASIDHTGNASRYPEPVSLRLLVVAVVAGLALTGCSDDPPAKPVSVEPPALGACRLLEIADIARSSNATTPVDCGTEHTAETYAVAAFTGALAEKEPGDPALAARAYQTCQKRFLRFVGATESLAMRSLLTWAYFRPTEAQWAKGARWFRCDVVGGGDQSDTLHPLPETAKGLLLGKPDDRWLVCVNGESVAGSVKIPCSEPHTWRAVTTIVLGKAGDRYPGDRMVEVQTRDFCSDSVGAWLNYPLDYDYGYTWFKKAEWQAGNRRSICWARTDQ